MVSCPSSQGGTIEHRETMAQFQQFLSGNWEELQAQHLFQAQTFVATLDQGLLMPMFPSNSSFTSPPTTLNSFFISPPTTT